MNTSEDQEKRPAAKSKARKLAPRPKRTVVRSGSGGVLMASRKASLHNGPKALVFWAFVGEIEEKTEWTRLEEINKGLSAGLSAGMREALGISFPALAQLLNTSTSTLERKLKGKKPLDLDASERLDRIAQITGMAEDILESREEASRWLTRAHPGLGQREPISLCSTEIGARQVRRVLSAMEWGNVA